MTSSQPQYSPFSRGMEVVGGKKGGARADKHRADTAAAVSVSVRDTAAAAAASSVPLTHTTHNTSTFCEMCVAAEW